jgi:NAD(P)H-hydrate epimerase
MAAAGMGDVLTGVIGALLAQGCTLEEAAVCGVEVHARAGDAAAGSAPRGLLASDLLPALRAGVNP